MPRSCALVHKETKEDAGAKPTARLHSEVAESSVTLRLGTPSV